MANIRTLDMKLIEDALAMGGGYVLNFSNRTFATFFAEEFNIDIDDIRYAQQGTSKASRLRALLKHVDLANALKVLDTLWAYRQRLLAEDWRSEFAPHVEGRFLDLLNRLRTPGAIEAALTPFGQYPSVLQAQPAPAFDRSRLAVLRSDLIALSLLSPQPRGYGFEKFLKDLFNAHGLQAREPFRLHGEQIDGSFLLSNEVYLLEAKWQNEPTGAGDLHAFQGKLSQKATWARGLFVSHSGFTDVGLEAWGRGKSVVCMDGHDLWDLLDREIPLDRVLELKIRRAAETGAPFLRVRDLFPS